MFSLAASASLSVRSKTDGQTDGASGFCAGDSGTLHLDTSSSDGVLCGRTEQRSLWRRFSSLSSMMWVTAAFTSGVMSAGYAAYGLDFLAGQLVCFQ